MWFFLPPVCGQLIQSFTLYVLYIDIYLILCYSIKHDMVVSTHAGLFVNFVQLSSKSSRLYSLFVLLCYMYMYVTTGHGWLITHD